MSRPLLAGIDGSRAGWFAVWLGCEGAFRSAVFATPNALCEALADTEVIAVDIPIGLSDGGPRQCDQLARQALHAPRASSVFTPPSRSVLNASTREEASRAQRLVDGCGIGAQTWGIISKIREWDGCLRAKPTLAKRIFEVHPEVCFWALNAFHPMRHSKKSPQGRLERRRILAREFGGRALDEARSRHARCDVAEDDLHDAFAALWTAGRIHSGVARCLPESPSLDAAGLRMGIWY